jgi:hypothetical protein
MSQSSYFEIKEYYEGSVYLNKVMYDSEPRKGISPTYTQSLLLNRDEIPQLIEILKNYANERRKS